MWLLLSKIAFGSSPGPNGCRNVAVRLQGRDGKMKKPITIGVCAGIDVGKDWLDLATRGGAHQQLPNQPDGFTAIAAALHAGGVTRVGLEASGGYEQKVTAFLRREGFEVVVLQPAQVRAFAHFRLQRAKNDRIDAALIAECVGLGEPRLHAHDERLEALAGSLTFIEQIEEDIARLKTRREACRDERILALLADELRRLTSVRRCEIARLAEAVSCEPDLAHRLALLESIPGIGRRTALALLVRMPELGHVTREQAAALVGVAPFEDQSGRRDGARHIAGGRARLRRSLYAAALPAAFKWNEPLKAFYQRLVRKGKSHKLALIACVRKLVIFANAVVQRGKPWTQHSSA
jgi:transposase